MTIILVKHLLGLGVLLALAPLVHAEVYVESEFAGYFDSGGTYTVVGAIKNSGDGWVTPSLTVSIDDLRIHDGEFTLAPVGPGSELPFKVKFPGLSLDDPVLLEPGLSYRPALPETPPDMQIIYDDTLILHPDGHKTGRIINVGDEPARYIKVYALLYSSDGILLDMGQSVEVFEAIEPGGIREFSIYPDPSIADSVASYSCFALMDTSIITVDSMRNGLPYLFRYDSGIWLYDFRFDEGGKKLSMTGYNGLPLGVQANFEFPRNSDSEQFRVFLKDELLESSQSVGEMGNWHLIFEIPSSGVDTISILGFEDPGRTTPLDDMLRPSSDPAAPAGDGSLVLYLAVIPAAAAAAGVVVYRRRR